MAFLDQQISDPYNQSIRKVKATLQGIRSDLCYTDRLLFNFVKQDVLAIIRPPTKVLQESEVILPALISSCQRLIKVIGKLLNAQGVEAFSNTEIFSSTANILKYLQPNEEEVIPQRATRNATRENPTNSHSLFHDFLSSGDISEFETVFDHVNCFCRTLPHPKYGLISSRNRRKPTRNASIPRASRYARYAG